MNSRSKRAWPVPNRTSRTIAILLSGLIEMAGRTAWGAATPTGAIADLDDLYHDLHAHPELSFQEQRTSKLLADRVAALSYEVTRQVGRTGSSRSCATGRAQW